MKCFHFMIIFFIPLLFIGCGSSSSSSDTTGSSTSTVTLSGTLGTGTISSNLVRFVTAASGYTVVAVNNASNKTYRATTEADGSFTLDVPSGSSYVVSLINEGSYVGPVVFDGSGSSVNTAITPSADEDLGSVTVDTTNGFARTTEAPSSINTTVTSVATDGIPVGAGDSGKSQQSDITNRDDSDMDQDGIPNIFDADEDNDGFRNGITETPSGASVVSDYIETVQMNSNIWADHNTTEEAKDLIALRLHVYPVSGMEGYISTVQCIDVPSSIADVATIRWASSLGVSETNYPDENSLWSDSDYNLYHVDQDGFEEEWIVSITPRATMNVGDTFTIRVTYTDSTYEDFFLTTSYFLTDWARVSTYNGTTITSAEGLKTAPVTISSETLEIVFTKPRDEDGNVLEGLSYSLIHGESDCSTGTCAVATASEEDTVTDEGGETLTHSVTLSTAGTYYITPVAESSDGQRNGEELWFTKN